MILVLADDITGAAEIAGTALRYGMKTSLITGMAGKTFPIQRSWYMQPTCGR